LPGIASPRLVPFTVWHPHDTSVPLRLRPLLQAIEAEFARRGWAGAEPLRWAITAVEPDRGLRIEGIGLQADPACPAGDAG